MDHLRSEIAELATGVEAISREPVLSVVIPAFNEAVRLPRTVMETLRWCSAQNLSFEVVIVDDGSRDDTLALARVFSECDSRVRTMACVHTGKGGAVRVGMLNAKGRYVLFMDADGATPLPEIAKLLALMQRYDIAIGSRAADGFGEVEVRTSFRRRIVGRVFARIVNFLAVCGIDDTQCGFKMFRREAAEAVFAHQKIRGFAFDVEILFIAQRLGLSMKEIPVNWIAQPGSKVKVVRDSIRMLKDIIRIRWLHRDVAGMAFVAAKKRRAVGASE